MTTESVRPQPASGQSQPPGGRARPLPSALRVGISRGVMEIREFFRRRDSVVFTLSFPAILLTLFGLVFTHRYEEIGVTVPQIYVTGLLGSAVMSASFTNLGGGITMDREDGTLKRLRGTPMPRSAYFLGKVMLVGVISLLGSALVMLVGLLMLGLPLPSATGWLTLGWVFALGVVACSLLGIAVSSLVRNSRSVAVVISLPFLLLQFISGVFIPFDEVPEPLHHIASLFPLQWLVQGFRTALLPDAVATLAPDRSYSLGTVAMVLGAWIVVGLVLCMTTFRWKARNEG
ncbi:MAG: ABC transporter permease [Micromonosporaceae bacterium]